MAELEIIDAHAHVFKTADEGIRYQQALGNRDPDREGTAEELLEIMEKSGVSKTVMLLYMPTNEMFERRVPDLPKNPSERADAVKELREAMVGRLIRYNEWGVQAGKEHPELLPFVGADPVFMSKETLVSDLEDKFEKGAKGVKIVPTSLRIYLNDPRLWPVYEFCDRTGLPLLTQAGRGPRGEGGGWDSWGRPSHLKYALEEFKNLKVITAHFGRGYEDDVVELCGRFPGFYTDISSQVGEWDEPGHWTSQEGVEWIRKAGVGKVLYGTNYPGSDPAKYVDKLKALPMKENELELVASGNFKQLL